MHLALIQGGGSSSAIVNFVPILAIMAIFYFMVIRPASKQRRETQKMLEALKKGDRVVTSGGIFGVVQTVEGEAVHLKIAENVKVKVLRSAITGVTNETAAEQKSQ
jgi:preprotein translocase subunit YajC